MLVHSSSLIIVTAVIRIVLDGAKALPAFPLLAISLCDMIYDPNFGLTLNRR